MTPAGWQTINGKSVLVCDECEPRRLFASAEAWNRHVRAEHPRSAHAVALRKAKPKEAA